jgi:hypothetical protein
MDGNNKAEINKLLRKSKEFAECLRTSILMHPDAWYTLNCTIMKTLEYPMVATTMTEPEWDKIRSPLLADTLPASGMTQKYPFVVAYGPLQYQDLRIIHPIIGRKFSISTPYFRNPQCHPSQATSFEPIWNNCNLKWA